MSWFGQKPKQRPAIRVKYESGQVIGPGGPVDVCRWCGCVHTFFCPRIKRITYYPAPMGQETGSVEAVEFWEGANEELWGVVVELEEDPEA